MGHRAVRATLAVVSNPPKTSRLRFVDPRFTFIRASNHLPESPVATPPLRYEATLAALERPRQRVIAGVLHAPPHRRATEGPAGVVAIIKERPPTESPPEGYLYTPAQAHVLRVRFVEEELVPAVRLFFARVPALRSAMLCVGQFWNDEAADAVHGVVVFSELDEPLLQPGVNEYRWEREGPPDPNLPTAWLPVGNYPESRAKVNSVRVVSELGIRWDDN